MKQRAVRNQFAIFIVLLNALFVAAACGGATDSGPESEATEWDDEFSEANESSQVSQTDEPPADVETDESEAVAADQDSAPASSNPMAFLSQSDTRALWVWSESPGAEAIIENTGGAQDELLDFLAAPHGDASRAINRIFFEARQYSNVDRFAKVRAASYDPLTDPSKQESLRAFLKRTKSQGVAVEYLDGQAIWVASDANAEAPKQLCRDIVAFNKGTDDTAERFDGIHLDIEPHTVREGPYGGQWWENRLPGGYNAEWTERWKDILNSCRATIDAYTAETGHRIVLASDLGTDYAYYNKPIYEFLNRSGGPLDYLGIMNYFDNRPNRDGDPSYFYGDSEGEEITGGVIENLDSWDRLPVMFGVETGPESIAQDWQSFWQEGRGAMYQTIDTLMSDYNAGNMIGVAIHHYGPRSYVGLKQ
ncbi:hypothetical protein FIV42_26420 [Persicimonas caeni]|uniref:GH26 domain-containing protein n=1 Tax=Persicimonas caeni TaxID=2292766 RepID=A0A4Y6Q0M8_PERCE|nr:hypothetical protein [Persicimonas caeni]QDG54148.1 hypothetical protein FIV42_26420 [Persicimonas caeni]QED35369.1 hypothetical protein FRD00_26415 [Persicimonas caeni]